METDLAGRVIYANPSCRRLYGLAPDDPLGFNWSDLIHPEDRAAAQVAGTSAMADGAVLELVHRIVSRDGSVRWVEGSSVPVLDDAGHPTGRMAVAVDVTRRRKAEEDVRMERELLRLIMDSTAEAIYGIDLAGCCTFANAACLRLTGYSSVEEVLGKNMHDLLHYATPDGRPIAVVDCKIFKAFTQGDEVQVDDEGFWRKDGSYFPVEYSSYPIVRDGVIEGAVVTFADTTERRRVATALRESQARYQQIVQTANEGIWMLDAQHRTTYVNATMARMLGYSAEELLGRSVEQLLDEADVPQFRQHLAEREAGKAARYERRYRRKDGGWVWASVSAQPVLDANGQFGGSFGMFTDITDRKGAEERQAKLRPSSGSRRRWRRWGRCPAGSRTTSTTS